MTIMNPSPFRSTSAETITPAKGRASFEFLLRISNSCFVREARELRPDALVCEGNGHPIAPRERCAKARLQKLRSVDWSASPRPIHIDVVDARPKALRP